MSIFHRRCLYRRAKSMSEPSGFSRISLSLSQNIRTHTLRSTYRRSKARSVLTRNACSRTPRSWPGLPSAALSRCLGPSCAWLSIKFPGAEVEGKCSRQFLRETCVPSLKARSALRPNGITEMPNPPIFLPLSVERDQAAKQRELSLQVD